MNSTIESLKTDLTKAKKKDIETCIRRVNEEGNFYTKIHITGRKDELVERLVNFIYALLANNRRSAVADVVRIVNDQLADVVSWRFEDNTLVICSPATPKKAPASRRPQNVEISELSFKESPFIKPVERLTTIRLCPVSSNSRQSKAFQFSLSSENRELLASSSTPSYQLRFYCSRYTGITSNLLVEFPPICEVRVNDCVIAGSSLRCLKGKPGTVHPPDISVMVKKKEPNSVELIYINNDAAYVASVYLVEKTSVSDLIKQMKQERVMSKEEVLEKLKQTQQDSDIIMESETLSTKDPLAFTRIITPIRSKSCHHLQCFDANIYLTMNEQTPTWSCPVCYRPIENFEDLFVDEYFDEMLKNTPKHIDSVLVELNGQITIVDEKPDLAGEQSESEDEMEMNALSSASKEPVTILLDDDDDEDEEVWTNTTSAPPPTTPTTTTTPIPAQPLNNQSTVDNKAVPENNAICNIPPASAEQQKASYGHMNGKRKRTEVIDLTVDSEDEESEPQEKRARNSTEIPGDSQEDLILPHHASLYTSSPMSENSISASSGVKFSMDSSNSATPEPSSRATSTPSDFSSF